MKFYTRLFPLLLASIMLFSLVACSNNSSKNEPTSEDILPDTSADTSVSPDTSDDSSSSDSANNASTNLLPDDFVVDTSVEDVCLATLGVPGNFELFTVDGSPVTAYSYLYWLLRCIDETETYMSYFGMPLDLSAEAPFAEYIKTDSLSAATHCSIVESKAKELGFELTDAQISELDFNMALTAEYMGGEEAFQENLRKAGFDYDTFYAVNAASYYYAQLTDNLFSTPPTAEEMDAYIEENDILSAKHILLMTVDSTTREPLDEVTIAQKKATAESILTQLQNSTNLETDFDALMNEHSEDTGLAYNPDGYIFTAGEMVTEFENATRALEYGQISGLVESPYGYHIILRLDPDTEATRADCLTAQANNQITVWSDEANVVVSDEYNAIDVALFHAKYSAYQAAFSEEVAAAESQAN